MVSLLVQFEFLVKTFLEIYTFTRVVYAGTGIELSTPYWQVDVEVSGLATIPKSYLLCGEPYIGMKVKVEFRTKKPTNTVLDYCWVPLESQRNRSACIVQS